MITRVIKRVMRGYKTPKNDKLKQFVDSKEKFQKSNSSMLFDHAELHDKILED